MDVLLYDSMPHRKIIPTPNKTLLSCGHGVWQTEVAVYPELT